MSDISQDADRMAAEIAKLQRLQQEMMAKVKAMLDAAANPPPAAAPAPKDAAADQTLSRQQPRPVFAAPSAAPEREEALSASGPVVVPQKVPAKDVVDDRKVSASAPAIVREPLPKPLPHKPAAHHIQPAAPQRFTRPPPLHSDRQVYDLQRLLNAMRFNAGEPDDDRGPKTNAAIDRFAEKFNERADAGEWPASALGKISDRSKIEDLLTAARAELVDRTQGRIRTLEENGGGVSLVRPIQSSLKLLGFYDGVIDGKRTAALDKAIQTFSEKPYRALGKDAQPLDFGPQLTGQSYVGRQAPQRYLHDSELVKPEMTEAVIDSLRPYANEKGWVGVMWAQDAGVTKRNASRAVGGIAFYNVNTGEYYRPEGDKRRHAFSMMSGGAPDVSNRPHEWNRNGATPGLWETDHHPDPHINLVSRVQSHNSGHRWGFFTNISHPYVGKDRGKDAIDKRKRDDDIGIHPDVGGLGSHGCPNVQTKDEDAYQEAMRKTKVKHVVTLSRDVVFPDPREPESPARPQRRSDLPDTVRDQVQSTTLSLSIGEGREAQEPQSQKVADARDVGAMSPRR